MPAPPAQDGEPARDPVAPLRDGIAPAHDQMPLARDPVAPALEAWLRKNLDASLELTGMTRPKGGFSAHTLLLTVATSGAEGRGSRDWVVRLEQSGREIFLDTDIGRQADMMRALGAAGIPVPVVLGVERDRSVLGGQFLVMERVVGHSLPQHPSYQVAGLLHQLPPERRYATWKDAITTIARINRLEWRKGFTFLDKAAYGAAGLDQYLGWLRRWKHKATDGQPHPVIDKAMVYLESHKPASNHVDVLWGDSNPGNILFGDDGHVAAAHDFEASALGPGEIDLGWWFFIDEMLSLGVPRLDGLPDRAAQIAIYEQALGRPTVGLDYYEVLAGVRICLVVVRSTQTYVREGRLAPDSRAGLENPIVGLLARKLGMDYRAGMDDYMDLVKAMNQR
jgi:aminoglycoside phosphotransferase (APT) family kinase protein